MGRFNGYSVATVQKSLIAVTPTYDSRQTALLGGLARVLDMKLGEVFFQHTLIPFEAAFSRGIQPFRDEQWCLSVLLSHRTRMAANRFCETCANQDLLERGFSYWRRSHQIPGVVLCPEHGEILKQIEDRNAVSCLPDEAVGRYQTSFESPADGQKFEIVQRYCELAFALLRRNVSSAFFGVQNIIDRRAYGRSIVDIANDLAPHNWLVKHFATPTGSSYGLADLCTPMGSVSSTPYVLALALLYETAEAALAALCNATHVQAH